MRLFFKKILFISILIFQGVIVSAQESDEDLDFLLFMEIPRVITSTLTQRDIIKAPSTMTVVTEEEIKSLGCSNLIELIDQLPGFYIRKNNYGYILIGIRGVMPTISSDKIKLLINGHAITESLWSSFSIFYNIALENVKQIEIVRGPGSSLYGTNAFAAIINVITKDAEDLKTFSLDMKRESFDTSHLNATYSFAEDDTSLVLNADYLKTDGAEPTLERDGSWGAPYSYSPGSLKEGAEETRVNIDYENGNFSLNASYVNLEKEPIIGQRFLTQGYEARYLNYFFIDAQYNTPLSDMLNISFKASVDYYDYQMKGDIVPDNTFLLLDLNGDGILEAADTNGDGVIEFWPEGGYNDFGAKSVNYKGEVLLDYNITGSNQVLFGLFFERAETYDVFTKANGHPIYNYSTHPVVVDYTGICDWNQEADRDIWGLFFQDEWKMNEDFYLVLGARYDDFSDFGSTFNPRCALVWDFNHMGGVVKLMYSTAFKAPTFVQLYNQNNPSLVGNTYLDAEEINSLELALSYIFREKLQTSLSLFTIETKDIIAISDSRAGGYALNPYFYENKEDSDILGSEVEAKYIFAERNYIFASYVYTDAEDSDTGDTSPWIPEQQATLGVNLFFKDMININLNMDYTGKMSREQGDPREDLKATTTYDFTVRFENVKGWDFYFSALNFTDEEVYSISPLASYPQSDIPHAGDAYRVGATYKY